MYVHIQRGRERKKGYCMRTKGILFILIIHVQIVNWLRKEMRKIAFSGLDFGREREVW